MYIEQKIQCFHQNADMDAVLIVHKQTDTQMHTFSRMKHKYLN